MTSKSFLLLCLSLMFAQVTNSKEESNTVVPIPEELAFRDIDALNAALVGMTEVEVGRIDPRLYDSKDQRLADRRERIIDWPVADIQRLPNTHREALDELVRGLFVRKGDESTTICFNPRHFIRGKVNGRLICILICFECDRWKRTGFRVEQPLALNQTAEATFERLLTGLGSVRVPDSEIPRPQEKPYGDDYKPGIPVEKVKVQFDVKKR